jgi:hypothetical protein
VAESPQADICLRAFCHFGSSVCIQNANFYEKNTKT